MATDWRGLVYCTETQSHREESTISLLFPLKNPCLRVRISFSSSATFQVLTEDEHGCIGNAHAIRESALRDKKDHIAYITVNRPKVLNALNAQTMEDLRRAFTAAKNDPEHRVVILTGAGEKAFMAGADINELRKFTPRRGQGETHRRPVRP